MDGMVLPLQPYCFTFILQIKKDNDVLTFLVRSGGWPGYNPPSGCVKENAVTKDPRLPHNQYPTLKYYIFCSTSLCNSITRSEMARQCFTKNEEFNPAAKSRSDSDGAQRAVICDLWTLSFLTTVSMVMCVFSSMRSAVLVGLVASLVRSADALQCYVCEDDSTKPASDTRSCYDAVGLKDTVNCPDRFPPPNNLDLVVVQKGYCATWVDKIPADKSYKTVIGRGCVYPGGPPDNCLEVEYTPRRPFPQIFYLNPTDVNTVIHHYQSGANDPNKFVSRTRFVKYCLSDRCNAWSHTAFVAECIDKTLTTRGPSPVMTTPAITVPTVTTKTPEIWRYWNFTPGVFDKEMREAQEESDRALAERARNYLKELEEKNLTKWKQWQLFRQFLNDFDASADEESEPESHAACLTISFHMPMLASCTMCLLWFSFKSAVR
ncbi:uncharacterized protein LOC129599467 isoform X2 [Paramacrobiotus metropolitanus]|nr:uncharacterized protein LOC129599467 isoform X2 [Paramacrobiotus metropolitanus]